MAARLFETSLTFVRHQQIAFKYSWRRVYFTLPKSMLGSIKCIVEFLLFFMQLGSLCFVGDALMHAFLLIYDAAHCSNKHALYVICLLAICLYYKKCIDSVDGCIYIWLFAALNGCLL